MKNLCRILNLSDDDKLFKYINKTFRNRITIFDYFVNWGKFFDNVNPIEKEFSKMQYYGNKK